MPSLKINWGFLVLTALVLFGVAYLLVVNSSSTKGYEISKLEKQLTAAKEASKRLELESSALKSIQTIQDGVRSLNMVPSGAMNYVKNQAGVSYQVKN